MGTKKRSLIESSSENPFQDGKIFSEQRLSRHSMHIIKDLFDNRECVGKQV